jgi:predicted transcriptional regulator
MARPRSVHPTAGEQAILRVLWSRGPSTVRQVHEALDEAAGAEASVLANFRGFRGFRGRGYTTTLKLMQIMAGKGLLTRDEREKTHVYAPAVSREDTQRRLLCGLVDTLFEGASHKLIIQALSLKRASRQELKEIRDLLDRIERKRP